MEKNGSLAAPSSKRKRRPRGAWLKEVRSLRDSGLSPEDYASKRGLVLSTLKFWMRIHITVIEPRTKSRPTCAMVRWPPKPSVHGTGASSHRMDTGSEGQPLKMFVPTPPEAFALHEFDSIVFRAEDHSYAPLPHRR